MSGDGRASRDGAAERAAAGDPAPPPEGDSAPLVSVVDLHVDFHTRDGVVKAVSGVSFDVGHGEIVAIVGESGSGKSATALSLLGLTREAGATVSGSVSFGGRAGSSSTRAPAAGRLDVLTASPRQLRTLRGDAMSIVFQDPLSSLNPVQRIGAQVSEQVRAHRDVSRAEAVRLAGAALWRAGLRDDERDDHGRAEGEGAEPARARGERPSLQRSRYLTAYPHELSGGQRQRAMIAMAICCEPALLVADEPTTALDVTTQSEILTELSRLRSEAGLSIVLVTHDLAVVSGIADRVLVMASGKIVEEGRTAEIFERPESGEAQTLLQSISRLYSRGGGSPHRPVDRPGAGGEAPLIEGGEARLTGGGAPLVEDREAPLIDSGEAPLTSGGDAPLLELAGVRLTYPQRHRGDPVAALRGVSVKVRRGETLGIVGESGCGKSTLLRCASRLLSVEGGTIRFDGVDVTHASRRALKPLRRGVQMVFQDPDASLNPRQTVERILRTPLRLRGVERGAIASAVRSLLSEVGLTAEHCKRFPHELSGGQRQRVGIARALAMEPALLLLDEPVSALDVSVRAQIVELLEGLRRTRGLSCVFVAHDIALVAGVSDRIAVMHDGQIVECGPSEDVYLRPRHEYTRSLLAAAPLPEPILAGDEALSDARR